MSRWTAGSAAGSATLRDVGTAKLKGSSRIRSMADNPPYAATVMSSPPTIAQAASATSGLTTVLPATRMLWSEAAITATTVTGATQARAFTSPPGYTPYFEGQSNVLQLSFDTDGASFDLDFYAVTSLSYRVWVNEQAAAATMTAIPSATNARAYLNVALGAATPGIPKRIVIELETTGSNRISVYGLRVAPTATVTLPSIASPRVFVMGDSYGVGFNATYRSYGYARTLGRLMGWSDVRYAPSIAGTGFVGSVAPYASFYETRIANDVVPYKPDLVIAQGSLNDPNNGTVGPAVTSFINAFRAALPGTPLVITGPLYVQTAPADILAIGNAIKASCLAAGVPYLDMQAPAVFTGTGRLGTTTGDGNADFFRDTDGIHPTNAGHYMIARALSGMLGQVVGQSV